MIRDKDSDRAVKSKDAQITVLSKSNFQFSAEHTDLLSPETQVLISPPYRKEINCFVSLGSVIKWMGKLSYASFL